MFEHLGPTPEVYIRKKATKFKMYLPFLFIAIMVFVLSLSISHGPISNAYGSDAAKLSAKLIANPVDKKIVYQANNFSVFDFVIDTERDKVSLDKLEVMVNGLYNLSLIDDLKIFHDGTQLGEVKDIDKDGRIYFDLDNYPLKKGQNLFRFILPNKGVVHLGDVLQFSIDSDSDIFLNYKGHLFTPDSQYPIESGLISFVDQGSIIASNQYLKTNFLVSSNVPQQLARFSLTSDSEALDLSQVTIGYHSDDANLDKTNFILASDDKLLSQASLDNDSNEIVFNLNKPVSLQNNDLKFFDFHALSLPKGYYNFYLKSAQAKGSVSGQEVSLNTNLLLSNIESRNYFLEIKSQEQNTRLSNGWNELYKMDIKAIGTDSINLDKLSFVLDKYGLDISDADLLVDGQTYIADIVIEANKIIIKSDAATPIKISDLGNELSLLVKVENVEKSAKLGARLLTDDQALLDDRQGNIIWSVGDNYFNSYKIPYLPLEPSILAN